MRELSALREAGFVKSGTLFKSTAEHPGKDLTKMRNDGYFSWCMENALTETTKWKTDLTHSFMEERHGGACAGSGA